MISLSPWLLVAVVFAVITLGVVAGFAITRARRLDRLHQRILASRDSLSRLLLRRASEADLLSRSAGLEGSGLADAARAYIQDGGDQLTTDGLDRRTAAQRQGDRVDVATRLERASALSRAIRETLTPEGTVTSRQSGRRILRPVRAWKRWMRRAIASSSHATCITWMSREFAPCVPHEW